MAGVPIMETRAPQEPQEPELSNTTILVRSAMVREIAKPVMAAVGYPVHSLPTGTPARPVITQVPTRLMWASAGNVTAQERINLLTTLKDNRL